MFQLKKVSVSRNVCFLVVLYVLFFASVPVSSSVLVNGNSEVDDQTFTFGIGKYEIDSYGDYFYITAKEGGAQEYTVARFNNNENKFRPICPEHVNIFGKDNQSNPVYSKAIKLFALINTNKEVISGPKSLNSYPILVTNDEPNKIYVLDFTRYLGKLYEEVKTEAKAGSIGSDTLTGSNSSSNGSTNKACQNCPTCQTLPVENSGGCPCTQRTSKVSLTVFDEIKNADNNLITNVNGVTGNSLGFIFAGVDFGAAGSGIATIRVSSMTVDEDKTIEDVRVDLELEALERVKEFKRIALEEEQKKSKLKEDQKDSSAGINSLQDSKGGNNSRNGSKQVSNKDQKNNRQNLRNKNNKNSNVTNINSNNLAGNKNNLSASKNVQQNKKTKTVMFPGSWPTLAINAATDFVKIGSDLANISFSDIYFDDFYSENKGSLLIAFNVQAASGATDGCKALVLGKVNKDGYLTLQNIAPDTAFSGTNQIVGAVGANAQVSIKKVRVMHTSNRLNYAIVLGGNGAPSATQKSVYAVPLVVNPDADQNYTLVDKNSLPEDSFSTNGPIKNIRFRYLKGIVQNPAQAYTNSDSAVQVGFGQLSDDIQDIFVVGDAVFALLQAPANNGLGGLFTSRALFDNYGKIKGWTVWQEISSSTDILFGSRLKQADGDFVWLTGTDINNIKAVERTIWSLGDKNGIQNLSEVVNELFPQNIAGVQGLFEFPYSAQGEPTGMNDITMLVLTGYKKILLAELASLQAGVLVRNTGDFASGTKVFTSGQIASNFPIAGTKVIAISGGALDNLGPIQAATVTSVSNNGRLFVGGIGGLAVLVDNNGNGWTTGLGPNFAGLTDTMAFRLVGNFGFVRKLLQDGNYLYILTDSSFYRADLTSGVNNFVTGVLDYKQIASLSNVPGLDKYSSFYDFTVSGKLGLLATSFGLFRVGNGKSVFSDDASSINWTFVPMPSALGPVKQLIPVSGTLREQDIFTQNSNGVLYVLSSYYGNDSAQFNRFTINYDTQVGDNTVLPFPDFYIANNKTGKGAYSYFMNFGMYRDQLDDEGAIRYTAESRNLSQSPYGEIILPGLFSGQPLPQTNSRMLPLAIEKASEVVKIIRSSTGPVIIAGDFGFKVNE